MITIDLINRVNSNVLVGLALFVSVMIGGCTSPSAIQPSDLSAFSTDGCSHYPDGTIKHPEKWEACCIEHDVAYWAGGVSAKRSAADAQLSTCVEQAGGGVLRSKIMWAGVRVGGLPYFPSRFRWGYGWPYYRGYKSISTAEQREIELKREGK